MLDVVGNGNSIKFLLTTVISTRSHRTLASAMGRFKTDGFQVAKEESCRFLMARAEPGPGRPVLGCCLRKAALGADLLALVEVPRTGTRANNRAVAAMVLQRILLLLDRVDLSTATGHGHIKIDLVTDGYAHEEIRLGRKTHFHRGPAEGRDRAVIEGDRARGRIDCSHRTRGFAGFGLDWRRCSGCFGSGRFGLLLAA